LQKFAALIQWFDTHAVSPDPDDDSIEWVRCVPFVALHLVCLGVFYVGWSWFAVGVSLSLYAVRMFAITGFYHRYFSHRSFKTSRGVQFLFALLGATAVQRGALWWASHHRHHHRHSDLQTDTHSPGLQGFWWSHVGWFACSKNFRTDYSRVRDLTAFPELVFLNRFDTLVPIAFAFGLFGIGWIFGQIFPELGTNGWQLFIWGFGISTVVLFHCTCSINSLAHIIGKQRYATGDESRNSFLLALVTMGEGWHNNHHYFMSSARQGFYWWEIDVTFYGLKLLESLGIIWALKPVPMTVYQRSSISNGAGEEVRIGNQLRGNPIEGDGGGV
jgi:stearoyl-CoA desaturase (delta-9 desaturase)